MSKIVNQDNVKRLRSTYLRAWVLGVLLVPTILDYFLMGTNAARFSRVLLVLAISTSILIRRQLFLISKIHGAEILFLLIILFLTGTVASLNNGGDLTPNILLLLILLFCVGSNMDLYDEALKAFDLSSYIIIWLSLIVILLRLNPLGLYFNSIGYPVFFDFIGIPGRNYGIFTHPNALGQAAAISLLFMISFKVKKIYLAAPVLCLFKCGSRTALISVTAGLILYGITILFRSQKSFIKRKKLESPLVAGTFMLLLLAASSAQFLQYINLLDSNSLTRRVTIWQSSLAIFKQSPLLGLGWGWETRAIQSQLINVWAVSAHNIVLEIIFATGILGLLIFLIFLSKILIYFTRLSNPEKLAIVAILISGLSESYIDLQYPTYYTFLFFAIVIGSSRERINSID